MVRRVTVTREHVLAYRGNVHDLMRPGSGAAVLDVGLQDHPPGRTALPALRLRTGNTAAGEGTALVHGVRGAMHLHRTADLALLSAALRHRDPRELAPATLGPFGAELSRAGVGLGDAMDEVAAAMTEATSDGVARAKGELSGAVSDRVDRRLTPWCEGCGTHHVQDALFRYATLQAGLVVEVASPRLLRYRRAVTPGARPDPEEAQAVLLRRFLRAMGPATAEDLAAWLGTTPAAARRWWRHAAADLVWVSVDGSTRQVHRDDLDLLTAPPSPPPPRLLTAYDPLTELADRRFLVPDAPHRRRVWRSVANPGVVLLDGEISGIWRQRTIRGELTITVTPFRTIGADQLDALERDAGAIAEHAGADRYTVVATPG